MSIFSFLTGAPKVVDNIFDKDKGLLSQVGGWIGGQQFTDQEQAEFNASMTAGVRAFAVATMEENTDRSKSRRAIAVAWFKMQVSLIYLHIFTIFLDDLIERLTSFESGLSAQIAQITWSPMLWGITGAISVFFFGAHIMRGSKLAKEDK